jgi:anti-anti-sigma regulatory factor
MFITRFRRQLLTLCFTNNVDADEMASCLKRIKTLIECQNEGFSLLINLSGLEHMDRTCAVDLGRIMDLCNARGVAMIVAVVPDPTKDIGLRLLSLFHFNGGVQIELHSTLPDAVGSLPGRSLALPQLCP